MRVLSGRADPGCQPSAERPRTTTYCLLLVAGALAIRSGDTTVVPLATPPVSGRVARVVETGANLSGCDVQTDAANQETRYVPQHALLPIVTVCNPTIWWVPGLVAVGKRPSRMIRCES